MVLKIFTSKPAWPHGITIIRVCTGIMIIIFGKELFDEGIMNNLTDFLSKARFPAPRFMAYLAKIIELAGGVLLILGLFTRLIVWPLMFTMAVIIWFTADGNFFDGGTASCFFLLFLLFFFTGPGRYSADYMLFDKNNGA